MNPRRSSRHSLLELLGIVGIVAVLAAVLCPVVAQARDASALSRMSALHTLRMAGSLYAQDYDLAFATNALATGDCAQTSSKWINAGGGCQDTQTGLTWSVTYRSAKDSGAPATVMAKWCGSMGQNGYSWRLPTLAEMKTAASDNISQYVSGTFAARYYYWSSDHRGKNDYYAHDLISETYLGSYLINYDGICVHP
jgi:hypothetical protein